MARLPAVTASEAMCVFEQLGFSIDRTRGSHHQLKKPGRPYVLTVPEHGNKPIKPGTLRHLIRAAGISVEEFVKLLENC